MLFACVPVVNGDWKYEEKGYKDAQCAQAYGSSSSRTAKLTSTHVYCMTSVEEESGSARPTEFSKEQRTCEGGSVVEETHNGCTDNTCSTCTGTKEKETQTSAEFDKEMSSVFGSKSCRQEQYGNIGTTVSGLAPANPCTHPSGHPSGLVNSGQRVSGRLQETVAFLTLLFSVVVWQPAE